MTKHGTFVVLLLAACTPLAATEPTRPAPMVREIFVPESDMDALLEGQPERMLLSRDEYEALLEKAEKTPEEHALHKALVVAADYEATVEQGRARLVGRLELEVLENGLWALPLNLSGAGIRRAGLDGRTAPMARTANDQLILFVEGLGRHQLVMELVAPMTTTAARQQLTLTLPKAPASRLRLTAPGDVEIKSGADVAERVVDEQSGVTRFDLPTASGALDLNLSLNSRLMRRDRVVAAQSVLVDEITEGYERLHATVSLSVLHRAVERFDFQLPDGFEITNVDTPQLARWAVSSQDGTSTLEVHLREPATDSVRLTLSALRTGADLANWSLPRFVPLDVIAQSSVVGLLVDQRLIAESVSSDGLIPIDTAILRRAIPETVFQAAPGAPAVRPITAWYAPQGQFDVAATFVKPPASIATTTNLLLILEDRRQRVQGGFVLAPEVEPVFDLDMEIPADWFVTSVSGPDGQPLRYEHYGSESEASRVNVKLPSGVEPGNTYRIYFEAESVPSGWLSQWERTTVDFPKFALHGVSRDLGAIAVVARDDMVAQPNPDQTQRLSILGNEDRAKYLAGLDTDLAYRYESPDYRLPLVISRTAPRLTAGTFSFLRIEPDAVVAHYELIYDVAEARTRRLSLSLPEDTPQTVAIRGLDGLQLKEYVSTVTEGRRRWDVLLAEPRAGRIRLAVDFYQPRSVEAQQQLPLPTVLAEDVIWQTGHLAVEGDAELEVTVHADPRARRVDVGELAEAEYQPGRRLLGVFGFADRPGDVTIDVIRREGHNLFAAIVHQARLVSRLSADGICQTAADYQLASKVSMLEVALPQGAELWSGTVDGKPIQPQKQTDRWLIHLPAKAEGETVHLELMYEMPVAATAFRGDVDMPAPELLFRGQKDTLGQRVPVADFRWDLYPPSGCTVLDSTGTVMWQPDRPAPAVWNLARGLGAALFGSPWLLAAREARLVRQDRVASETATGAEYEAEETAPGREEAAGTTVEAFNKLKEMPVPEMKKRAAEAMDAPAEEAPPAATPEPQAPPSPVQSAPQSGAFGVPAVTERLVPQRRGFKSVNALRIELQTGPADQEDTVTFTSLGTSPRLAVTLADAPGISKLSWAIAMLVLLVGVILTKASLRRKLTYVLAVICIGTLIPLLGEILPFLPGMSLTLAPANAAVYAAGLLLPYYLVVGLLRWLAHTFQAVAWKRASAAVAVSGFVVAFACLQTAAAAEPPQAPPYVVEIVDSLPPVTIPDDAVVIPYDATRANGVAKADRILVPYAKYVELWNRAYPDAKKTVVPPPAPYALAGVSYQMTLGGDGDLLLDGRMEIDLFVDERTEIPLGVEGGVFAKAELDGRPARLSVPVPTSPENTAEATRQQADPAAQRPIVLVHVEGKGRHLLQFTLRMRLERSGGWRTVQGRVPSAPMAATEIRVPEAETEVLLQHVHDRPGQKTEQPDEMIRTALGPDGILSIRWRPSVAEGVVDQSLTAQSSALLDVQEDGVRLAWNTQLEFRRSTHEQFSVYVPKEYLVKRIDGANIRGWEVEKGESHNKVTITLLKAAEGSEHFTLHLWLGQANVGDEPTQFTAPVVRVDGAALHQGRMTIRRSPMLDLRVESVAGATRTDMPEEGGEKSLAIEESPWGLRPFQAYRFGDTDFQIALSAQPVKERVSAVLQSILRIKQHERSLECRVRYNVSGRKLYRAEILLPQSFQLDNVTAPGEFEWSVTDHQRRPKLTVLLASGQEGAVTIVFQGRLAGEISEQDVPLPNVQVLRVPFSPGQMAVQVDPVYDVAARDLAGCNTALLSQIAHWVSQEQQAVTAVALVQFQPDYSGTLRLTERRPDVHCETITNLCVTDRALKETIVLDYRIERAGVREVSFLLPAWMADAKFRVPMLRQKTIEPEGDQADSPLRVRLQIQDEIMGELRVLVENDRTLETGVDLRAPIPTPIKGERFGAFSVQQFVVLEKAEADRASLDNIIFDDDGSTGLLRLNRRQHQWTRLKSVFGDRIIEAFEVSETAEDPQLVFRARRFEARQTTDARIGKAETRFVLDGSGAYRAEQLFWVDNKTEQYFEIAMPGGAELWAAQLWTIAAWAAHDQGQPASGEPLKPTKAPPVAGQQRIRIPLVKTEEGDLDYIIRLQYAGSIGAVGTWTRFDLPFIQPVGIKVDYSRVRLFVPETHWFSFDDTMTLVRDEWDLRADEYAYETRNLEKFKDVLREGNPYAQARALNSVSVLSRSQVMYDAYGANERFQAEQRRNAAVTKEVQDAAGQVERSLNENVEVDNRDRLRRQVDEQTNYFARNVVQGLDDNFKADREAFRGATTRSGETGAFNSQWLDSNQLSNVADATGEKMGKAESAKEAQPEGRIVSGKQSSFGRDKADLQQINPGVQQQMPAAIDGKDLDAVVAGRGLPKVADEAEKALESVNRYRARHLEQQQGQVGQILEGDRSGNARGESFGGGRMGGIPLGQPPADVALGLRSPEALLGDLAASLPAGLASLDFEIPFRGREYRFTTPQGDVRISGYAYSENTLHATGQAIAVLLLVALAGYVLYLGSCGRFNWWLGRTGSTCLIALGMVAFLCLPVIGLLATVGGVMIKVNRAVGRLQAPGSGLRG